MNLALALGLLAATALPQDANPVGSQGPVVEGVIRTTEEGVRVPLPYATVEILDANGRWRSVMTDSKGVYSIANASPGRRGLRAKQLGYGSVEVAVLVPNSGKVDVDLLLSPQALTMPPLIVEVARITEIEAAERRLSPSGAGPSLVGLRALEASPGLVESGLGEAVRALPGNDSSDPTDVLLMRGSTADMKLVLLDGAPVYAPFHTGGLLQSFDMSTLGGASHHVGGAPARYDGGLSYILDLRTRSATSESFRTFGSLDLMSAHAGIETPLGPRAGILATGRALHDGAGRLAGGDSSPYGYVDGLVRGDLGIGTGKLSLTGFANRESVRLDLPGSPGSPGIDQASWGNDVLAAAWRSPFGSGSLEVTLASTVYRAELPVRLVGEFQGPTGHHQVRDFVATGQTDRTRLAGEMTLPSVAGGLRLGASVDRTRAAYGARPMDGEMTLARTSGSVLAAYVDGTRELSPEFDLRYGARVDGFDPGGLKGALRMALLWALGPDAVLTIAAGRYHQLIRPGETEADLAVGNALDVGTAVLESEPPQLTPVFRVASADHLTLSLDQDVTREVRLGFEGFLKRFRGLAPSVGSELSSSGADLRIVRETDATTAWLGYSLSWFWESGVSGPDFSGQHLLSAGLQRPVFGPVGLDLRFSFSDGLPLTAIALERDDSPVVTFEAEGQAGTRATPTRSDGFLRLDAEVFAEWTGSWAGRETLVRPYVRILNALDRRDALFYYFEPWRGEGPRPLTELPLVPVLGLEWRF